MPSRRERLVGHRYEVSPSVTAEIRKSCRDEVKILYSGGPFDDTVWERLRVLGPLEVFEASKVSASMKDIVRLRCGAVRLEGARGGALVVAFFGRPRVPGMRRRVEALLADAAATAATGA